MGDKNNKRRKVVKVLPDSSASKSSYAGGVLRFIGINSASDIDGEVLMTNDCFEKVFGTKKKTASYLLKQSPIVKICSNGKKIYRTYRGVSADGFDSDLVALSPNSIMLLNDDNGKEPQDVIILKGSKFPFYWNHPDKAVHLSFKLGLLSMLLGIVSIFISIIGIVCK